MTLPHVAGTQVRGSKYHLNLRVPPALQSVYGTHVRRSLRTADPRVAADAVADQKAEFRARQRELDARNILQRQIENLPTEERQLYDRAGSVEELRKDFARVRVAFLTSHPDQQSPANEASSFYDREMHKAILGAAHRGIEHELRTAAKALRSLGQEAELPDGVKVEGLRELASAYCDAKGSALKTRAAIEYVVRRFIELHSDMPLAALRVAHLRDYANAVVSLPATVSGAAYRDLTFHEAAAKAKADGSPTVGERTCDKHISFLKALTAFAADQGYLDTNLGVRSRSLSGAGSIRTGKRNPACPSRLMTRAAFSRTSARRTRTRLIVGRRCWLATRAPDARRSANYA